MTEIDLSSKTSDPRTKYTLIIMVGVLFALSLGMQYGTGDQTTTLIPGLKLIDRNFIPHDWFAWHTKHFHLAYGYLIYFLSFFGPLPAVTSFFYVLIYGVLFLGTVYFLLELFYEKPFLPFITSAVVLRLLAGHAIFSFGVLHKEFGPSYIGIVFFLAGITLFLYQKYLFSGILLGLAALLEVFYVWMVPLVLLPLLIFNRESFTVKNIFSVVLPFTLLCLPLVIYILNNFVSSNDISNGKDFVFLFRTPHHVNPLSWGIKPFRHYAGFLLLGAGGWFSRPPFPEKKPMIKTMITGSLFFIGAGLFFTIFIYNKAISQFHLYRIGFFPVFFSLIFFSAAAARLVEKYPAVLKGEGKYKVFIVSTGIGFFLLASSIYRYDQNLDRALILKFLSAFFIPLVIAYFYKIAGSDRPKWIESLCSIGLVIILLENAAYGMKISNIDLFGKDWVSFPEDREEIYDWVRNSTPRETAFIVPLNTDGFRINARRAIVVNWKDAPLRDEDAREWYRRICLVSGVEDPKGYNEVVEGYYRMDSRKARRLANEFKAGYLLVERKHHSGSLDDLESVFQNKKYEVYKVPGWVSLKAISERRRL